MKKFPAVLTAAVLGAAGFAAAGIASGGSLLHVLTGTTEATVTTTPAGTTTGESGGGQGRRVTLCHRTGSKKHPYVTITVSQNAVKAHLKHHDLPGACPTAQQATTIASKGADHGNGHDNGHKPTTTTTATTATTTTTDSSNGHGNSGSHGHGKP